MSLDSGERQVSPTLHGIRRDHVARYRFVAGALPQGSTIIDFACGVGYGSRVMADADHIVRGYDIDSESIEYARQNYGRNDASESHAPTFYVRNANAPGDLHYADAAVCFETIEHIQDPRPLLKALRLSANTLFASVPNEEVFPYLNEHGQTIKFHFRHYTKHEFSRLLNECGWRVIEWHGQEDHESDVEYEANGRTLIAVCEHGEIKESEPETGKHIAILGLGESVSQYLDLTKRLGGRSKYCDEVWAINALGDVLACDLIFHMDDVRIQEIRAEADPQSNIASMLKWLRESRCAVMTSRAHPDYPCLVEYPLEDVLNNLGHDYFNNTAAYAVAYAIHMGASKISCFGMDYSYANSHQAEKGRACTEFWLGYARAKGIQLVMPQCSSLMDANCDPAARLYGYDTLDVAINVQESGQVKLEFTEREDLPTAEQIEANYDHSKPTTEQHKRL